MSWKGFVTGAAVLAVLTGFASFAKHHEVTFDRLQQAKTKLAALGYHCTSDTANGELGCGFMISRGALNWNEVGSVCKTGPMGPEWEGKLWVTLNPSCWRLEGVPDHAGVRVWGATAMVLAEFLALLGWPIDERP